MSDSPTHCLGALALELTPGTLAARTALEQVPAGALAALVAQDLARFVPDAAALDLVLVGAHFDPVELLRPGWPVHAGLADLAAGAPRRVDGARVIAFGARDGQVPGALAPDPNYVGGPLRLLPFVLRGAPARVTEVGARLEATLIETGMAGASTALAAQDGFGAEVEHARYLTLHDLAAMMALQYEHAGLAPLWPLLEAALLAPEHEEWLDAPPEPLARYAGGEVRLALLDIDAWAEGGFAPREIDATHLTRAFEAFETRQRQFTAVLNAHGVPVTFDHCPAGKDPRALLRA